MKFYLSAFLLFFFILCFSLSRAEDINEEESVASVPVFYPEEKIASGTPFFIWFDLYNERDVGNNVKYRITLKTEKEANIKPVLLTPASYEKYYYFFKWPYPLEPEKYAYTIDRLSDLKETRLKFFHYLKYPVKGEFEIDPEDKTIKDELPPEKLIEYLRLEKENRLINRNNFFFYIGAGAGAFGIGLLFYKVLHFGIISKIIYYIAFASSAAGAGAAAYYGVNYFIGKYNLQKIAGISDNVSISGSVTSDETRIMFERKL